MLTTTKHEINPEIVGILIFISRINTTSEPFKARKIIYFSLFYLLRATEISDSVELIMNFFYKLRAQGYKTFFMLNSTVHDISTAHKKTKILTNEEVFCFKYLICCVYHANKC